MRLNLRTFLIVSVFLGAVAIPVGYKSLQARREAEIERLATKLKKLWAEEPFDEMWDGNQVTSNPFYVAWERKVAKLESRLGKLTGRKPVRLEPPPRYQNVLHHPKVNPPMIVTGKHRT